MDFFTICLIAGAAWIFLVLLVFAMCTAASRADAHSEFAALSVDAGVPPGRPSAHEQRVPARSAALS